MRYILILLYFKMIILLGAFFYVVFIFFICNTNYLILNPEENLYIWYSPPIKILAILTMSNKYNREKFEKILSRNPSKWAEKHKAKKESKTLGQDNAMAAINVLTLLEDKKWSQEQLAQLLNISPDEVNKIVKGKVNFSIELIATLEKALGQNITQIN